MGAIANIVLNDAESTPVVHTFKPSRQGLLPNGQSVAAWEDRAVNNGTPVGYYKINSLFSPAMKQRPSYKVVWDLETPVLEVLSNSSLTGFEPGPQIAHLPKIQVVSWLPERSALQARMNLQKLLEGLVASTAFKASIIDLDFTY